MLESFGIEQGRGKFHEEAIYSLALIYNVINDRVAAYLKEYGLTPGKFNILMIVKHQGGERGISQVEVSKRLIVTPSNMTKLIDKLEREGYMKRSSLPGDRRVNILKITEKGERVLEKSWDGYDRCLREMFACAEGKDQKALAGGMVRWLENLVGGYSS